MVDLTGERQQKEQLIFIDSRLRDTDRYPGPFSYRINFQDDLMTGPLRNVQELELLGVSFPKSYTDNNPDLYFWVHFEEMDGIMVSNDNANIRGFAMLYFDPGATAQGAIVPVKAADYYEKRHRVYIPQLSSLTISFKKYQGALITSSDVAPASGENTILLRVKYT